MPSNFAIRVCILRFLSVIWRGWRVSGADVSWRIGNRRPRHCHRSLLFYLSQISSKLVKALERQPPRGRGWFSVYFSETDTLGSSSGKKQSLFRRAHLMHGCTPEQRAFAARHCWHLAAVSGRVRTESLSQRHCVRSGCSSRDTRPSGLGRAHSRASAWLLSLRGAFGIRF